MTRLTSIAALLICLCPASVSLAQSAVSYKVLATSKTSTMQKELQEAGDAGYAIVGMTVGQTAMGGNELVSITRRRVR